MSKTFGGTVTILGALSGTGHHGIQSVKGATATVVFCGSVEQVRVLTLVAGEIGYTTATVMAALVPGWTVRAGTGQRTEKLVYSYK